MSESESEGKLDSIDLLITRWSYKTVDFQDDIPAEVSVPEHYSRQELQDKFVDIEDFFILLSDKKFTSFI